LLQHGVLTARSSEYDECGGGTMANGLRRTAQAARASPPLFAINGGRLESFRFLRCP
jgi:hypothetical protein